MTNEVNGSPARQRAWQALETFYAGKHHSEADKRDEWETFLRLHFDKPEKELSDEDWIFVEHEGPKNYLPF